MVEEYNYMDSSDDDSVCDTPVKLLPPKSLFHNIGKISLNDSKLENHSDESIEFDSDGDSDIEATQFMNKQMQDSMETDGIDFRLMANEGILNSTPLNLRNKKVRKSKEIMNSKNKTKIPDYKDSINVLCATTQEESIPKLLNFEQTEKIKNKSLNILMKKGQDFNNMSKTSRDGSLEKRVDFILEETQNSKCGKSIDMINETQFSNLPETIMNFNQNINNYEQELMIQNDPIPKSPIDEISEIKPPKEHKKIEDDVQIIQKSSFKSNLLSKDKNKNMDKSIVVDDKSSLKTANQQNKKKRNFKLDFDCSPEKNQNITTNITQSQPENKLRVSTIQKNFSFEIPDSLEFGYPKFSKTQTILINNEKNLNQNTMCLNLKNKKLLDLKRKNNNGNSITPKKGKLSNNVILNVNGISTKLDNNTFKNSNTDTAGNTKTKIKLVSESLSSIIPNLFKENVNKTVNSIDGVEHDLNEDFLEEDIEFDNDIEFHNQNTTENIEKESEKSQKQTSSFDFGRWVWYLVPGNNSMYSPVLVLSSNSTPSKNKERKNQDNIFSPEKKTGKVVAGLVFCESGVVQVLQLQTLSPAFCKPFQQNDRIWATRKRRKLSETGTIQQFPKVSLTKLGLGGVLCSETFKKSFKIPKSNIPEISILFDKDCNVQYVPINKVYSTAQFMNLPITPQKIYTAKMNVINRETSNKRKKRTLLEYFGEKDINKLGSVNELIIEGDAESEIIKFFDKVSSELFKNMHFMVTFSPAFSKNNHFQSVFSTTFRNFKGKILVNKNVISLLISKHGGKVFSNPKEPESQNKKKDSNLSTNDMMILADSPSSTFKYLYGLASGKPKISLLWIFECIKKANYNYYTLSNGWSYELNTACSSMFNKNFMNGLVIMVCGSPVFFENWKILLNKAGAQVIKPPSLIFADSGSTNKKTVCDYVLSEFSPDFGWKVRMCTLYYRENRRVISSSQHSVLGKEASKTVSSFDSIIDDTNQEKSESSETDKYPLFVSGTWAKQCLINQRVLDFNSHSSYTIYSFKKSKPMDSLKGY
ncbi:hypothetical protein BB559_003353 [Furculomyces boomerangus]|uniref:BRCT domain-containing protein n=2 Tax=Harpellales TaxID=61421 RepID=A0A2T9YLM9_9FUNG|nr:hypothetical protein BB559_003353 [Furculomyces boomerangus]PWA00433.1 hypothetical protein BB558_003508 [Smittium angustum]